MAMKDKLKRMTAYHADDYDVAESDLHSELVLATTKVRNVSICACMYGMLVFMCVRVCVCTCVCTYV